MPTAVFGGRLVTASLDEVIYRWVVGHRADGLDEVFIALSVVGYAGLVWIGLAAAFALITHRSIVRMAAVTALCVWSADLASLLIKAVIDRDRPFEVIPEPEPLLLGTVGASLPSGHAATGFAGAIILVFLLGRAVVPLLILALAISYSRVYLGVHWPLDVVAGALLGTTSALLVGAWLRRRRTLSRVPQRSGVRRPRG